jgi:putative acetyltransferase
MQQRQVTAMAQAISKPGLRPFLPADAPLLAGIFQASVEELTGEDYSESQLVAWAAVADDVAAFAERLGKQLTLIALVGGAPVGFASLRGTDEFDMLYVHPAVVRQDVATALADAIEALAAARGAKRIAADASDTARPFFERRGYSAQQRNSVMLGGEWFANTSMSKPLPTLASAATTTSKKPRP